MAVLRIFRDEAGTMSQTDNEDFFTVATVSILGESLLTWKTPSEFPTLSPILMITSLYFMNLKFYYYRNLKIHIGLKFSFFCLDNGGNLTYYQLSFKLYEEMFESNMVEYTLPLIEREFSNFV